MPAASPPPPSPGTTFIVQPFAQHTVFSATHLVSDDCFHPSAAGQERLPLPLLSPSPPPPPLPLLLSSSSPPALLLLSSCLAHPPISAHLGSSRLLSAHVGSSAAVQELLARGLWNNLLQPAGEKASSVEEGEALLCPTADAALS